MKKIIFNMVAAAIAITAVACGANENTTKITYGNKSKMDSLSYAYGVMLADQYGNDSQMIKDLDIDTKVLWEAFNKTAIGEMVIVGNDTINESTMQGIYNRTFTRDLQSRIIAARRDSTGNTKVYTDAKERELISAFMGTDIAMGLIRMNAPMQLYWIEKGKEEASNKTATMSPAKADSYIRRYMMEVVPAENDKASKAWLAEVEKEKGVKKTASGLLYKIVREGDMNAKPTSLTDVVKVHYEGTTREGKVFDSSYKRNQTIDFPLNGVIKGWGEGLQLVGKGGKIILWIPSELAYGRRGAGADIGPNEALRFEVELFDVTPAAK